MLAHELVGKLIEIQEKEKQRQHEQEQQGRMNRNKNRDVNVNSSLIGKVTIVRNRNNNGKNGNNVNGRLQSCASQELRYNNRMREEISRDPPVKANKKLVNTNSNSNTHRKSTQSNIENSNNSKQNEYAQELLKSLEPDDYKQK